MKTRVVNVRHEAYDVYIGRPRSGQPWKFGNPFVVGRDGQRGECCEKFRTWILTGDSQNCVDATQIRRDWIVKNLESLRGKTLGCWCKPNNCHGDVYVELLNTKWTYKH